jgi:hypothetical protein
MRGNCEGGILGVGCGSGSAAALTASSLFAGPVIICSTRGLRSVDDAGALSVTAGWVSAGFDVNSASASDVTPVFHPVETRDRG